MSDQIFIVIPTRNRHDTLRHAVRTALAQPHDRLQVIVSDNCSSAETAQVVSEFDDPRLRYQRSGRPLSMVDSWEFALSGVRGEGFVHFMGDDNGLMPGAVESVLRSAELSGCDIVHGDVVQYTWPGSDGQSGWVTVPLVHGQIRVNARRALANAYRMLIGFARLPTINVAFVHTRIIERARALAQGRYFAASNPDVYSAVVNAYCVDSYVYSNTPLVVNGASHHSNGATGGQPGRSSFVEDTLAGGYRYHPRFPACSGYYFNVYEAFAVAADRFAADRKYSVPFGRVLDRTVREEYGQMGRTWLKPEIEEFARLNGLRARLPERGSESLGACGAIPARRIVDRAGDQLILRSEFFEMNDVFQASQVAGAIVGEIDLVPPDLRAIPLSVKLKTAVRETWLMGARRTS